MPREIRFQLVVIDAESYLDRGRLRGIDAARRMVEKVSERAPLADVIVHIPSSLRWELRDVFGRGATVVVGSPGGAAITHIRSRGDEGVTCALLSFVTDREMELDVLSRFAERIERVPLDQPLALTVLPIQPRMMTIEVVFIERWMRIDQTDYAGRQGATFLVTAHTERGRRGFIDSADRQGWVEKANMDGWKRQQFKPTRMVAEHSDWR